MNQQQSLLSDEMDRKTDHQIKPVRHDGIYILSNYRVQNEIIHPGNHQDGKKS